MIQEDKSATLACNNDQYLFQPVGADPYNGDLTGDKSATLGVNCGVSTGRNAVAYGISAYESNAMKSSNPHSGVYEADTSRTLDLNGGNPACNQGGIAIVEPAYGVVTKGNGDAFIAEERHTALTVGGGQAGQGYPCAMHPIAVATQQGGAEITENGVCPTITAAAGMSGNNQPWICHPDNSAGFCTEHSAKSRSIGYEEEISPTLRAGVTPAVVYGFQRQLSGVEAQRDVAPTILAAAGESGNNKPCVVYGVDAYNQTLTGDKAKTLNSAASDADHIPCAVYSVENHPADSRVNLDESGKVQCLTSRMGTGGGNVPMVMEPFCKEHRAKDKDDATTWKHGKVANTLNTFDQGEARANELVVETVALEGNGQRPSHRGDGYAETDKSYTLNATEVHGVAYSFDPGASRDVGALFIEECGKTLTNGTCPGHHDGVVIATDSTEPVLTASKASFFMRTEEELASTLVATDYKDPQLICTKYIVRRLTPTECARLQGFADRWGDIDAKSDLTDEEYRFWLEVRNTHAAINGKATKEYTKAQMLTWYNKLHTDSAEYKLWGNGIALPTALYVIQGIADAMKGAKND